MPVLLMPEGLEASINKEHMADWRPCGCKVFKTLLLIRRAASSDMPLDIRQKVWKINRRITSPRKVKHAFELVKQGPEKAGAVEWTLAG